MFRRAFVKGATVATAAALGRAEESPWGASVLDVHLHSRKDAEEIDHLKAAASNLFEAITWEKGTELLHI